MLTVKEVSKEIRALEPCQAYRDSGKRGSGSLWIKRTRANSLVALFRYSVNRKVVDMSLGAYDETGRAGLTLAEARDRAGELQRMIQGGVPDPKAWQEEQGRLAAEQQAKLKAEAEAAEVAARQAAEDRDRYSLAALLRAYCDHLDRQGKGQSARDSRSLFKVNILDPAPDLAALPAKEVTKAALATRIREVRESGRERSAGKTRAYLFAAFNLALRAEGDTEAPAAMIPFEIATNPVAGIKAIPVRPCSRVLSREELRAFIGKLGEGLADQALKLALYAGGQRGEQLLRAKASDFDPASGVLRLLDSKGRRQQPREHRLPLGPIAADLCKALVARARELRPEEADPSLFATSKTVLSLDTLSRRVSELATEMGGASFLFRDLRRTAETEMAAIGFSVDLRGQLLSHGLGGVQAVHYDKHSYLPEKTAALEKWERHLEGQEPAKVVNITARRRRPT